MPISTLDSGMPTTRLKDWLPGLGSQGRKGKGAIVILKKVEKHKWIKKKKS